MNTYRVTFGQKYRSEPHPTWAGAHPDGYLTIVAPDMETARRTTVLALGIAWSDIREDGPDDEAYYPRGELHLIDTQDFDLTPVTVCAVCLSKACWDGEFMCDDAQVAATVEIPAWQATS